MIDIGFIAFLSLRAYRDGMPLGKNQTDAFTDSAQWTLLTISRSRFLADLRTLLLIMSKFCLELLTYLYPDILPVASTGHFMLQKYALQLDFACTMLIIDHASTLLYIILALLSNYG